jgi:hypothetical protein
MLIKQLSVFLENKKGRFTEVSRILGDADINMTAFTVAENSDFGILRLIVSDSERAKQVLKEQRYAVSTTDVVCVQCSDKPGSLASIMAVITDAGIFVEYMYAFSFGEKALVIIRPDNLEKTVEALTENQIDILTSDELFNR